MHSTNLTHGTHKDGTINALYDGLNRVVVTFPTDKDDTRRGSPSTQETIAANAALFKAAADLLHVAKRVELLLEALHRDADKYFKDKEPLSVVHIRDAARAAIDKAKKL